METARWRSVVKSTTATVIAGCLAAASGVAGAQNAAPSVRDAGLAADVRAALAANTGPAARDVAVEVVDGVVRLGGTIAAESDRSSVLAAVDGVAGVESVTDAMQIGAPQPGAVAAAREAAERAREATAVGVAGAAGGTGNAAAAGPSTSPTSQPNVVPTPDAGAARDRHDAPATTRAAPMQREAQPQTGGRAEGAASRQTAPPPPVASR